MCFGTRQVFISLRLSHTKIVSCYAKNILALSGVLFKAVFRRVFSGARLALR